MIRNNYIGKSKEKNNKSSVILIRSINKASDLHLVDLLSTPDLEPMNAVLICRYPSVQ